MHPTMGLGSMAVTSAVSKGGQPVLRLRFLVSLVGTFLVFALLASGCAGDDDDEGQAAAAQAAGAEELVHIGLSA